VWFIYSAASPEAVCAAAHGARGEDGDGVCVDSHDDDYDDYSYSQSLARGTFSSAAAHTGTPRDRITSMGCATGGWQAALRICLSINSAPLLAFSRELPKSLAHSAHGSSDFRS